MKKETVEFGVMQNLFAVAVKPRGSGCCGGGLLEAKQLDKSSRPLGVNFLDAGPRYQVSSYC